ncbi:hypothetical protein DIPPA_02224 [Diplonema papillatum]|nr:hypothetical protein DIPPA_02224 [Diplonema papillatum]
MTIGVNCMLLVAGPMAPTYMAAWYWTQLGVKHASRSFPAVVFGTSCVTLAAVTSDTLREATHSITYNLSWLTGNACK